MEYFVRAKDCADLLGYASVKALMRGNRDIEVFPVLDGAAGFGDLEEHGYISAVSAFQRFGHRIVLRGRAVFDGYDESEAKERGLEDNTLWAAAQGEMSFPRVLELLEQNEDLDFHEADSTSTCPLGYMKTNQINATSRTRRFSQDPVSVVLWQRALASSSREHAEQALRDIIQSSTEGSWGDPSRVREIDLKILTSSLDFGSAIGALEPHQSHFFQGMSGKNPNDISNNQVLFCQWEAPRLLRDLFSKETGRTAEEVIGGLVTVSGSDETFDCCDCFSFTKRQWGASGSAALWLVGKVIDHLLDFGERDTVESIAIIPGSQDTEISYAATDSYLAVSLDTSLHVMTESATQKYLFEALVWICCAIRPIIAPGSAHRQLRSSKLCKELMITGRSSLEINPSNKKFILVKLESLTEELAEPFSRCWTRLFSSIPVVEMTIIRPWGRGLEIPFNLMVELPAVENICTFDGRIALLGYFAALIPAGEMEAGNCIQWHLEVVEPSEGMLLPRQLQQRLQRQKWIKIDTHQMHKKTCFLGWSSTANIMLGTEALVKHQQMIQSPHDLEFARSHLENDTVEAGFQISLGIPGIEPILKGSKAWKRRDNTIARSPVSDYRLSLNLSRRKTCLLVDSQSKQAWLVPVLSVVLHLCHLFYRLNNIGDDPTPIPFAEPSCDGAQHSQIAIAESHNLDVLGSRFSALFYQQYSNLVDHPRHATSRFFYANDLLHSMENKRTFPRKVPIRADGFTWPDLLPFATAVDAIAVGANIGQILQPVTTGGNRLCLCNNLSCHKLPIGCCYLAAHVPSFKHLCNLDGIISVQRCRFMLSETSWVLKGDPWSLAQCDGTSIWDNAAIVCNLLQETRPDKLKWWHEVRNGHSQKVAPVLKKIPSSGVVVFGRRQTLR